MKQLFFTAVEPKYRFIKFIEQIESREPVDAEVANVSQGLQELQSSILAENAETQEYRPLDAEFDRLEYEYWKRLAGLNNDLHQTGLATVDMETLVANRVSELEAALAQYGYFPPALGEPSRLVSGHLQPAPNDSQFSHELSQEFVANGYLWRRTIERAQSAVLQSVSEHQGFWEVALERGGNFFSLEGPLIFGTEAGSAMEDEFFGNLNHAEKTELIDQLNRWFEGPGRLEVENALANQ